MSKHARRLIEDYLPIKEVSAESSREKSVRKGHIASLHLWWARRPLVACRAAVFAAIIPAEFWLADETFSKVVGEEKRREIDRPVIRDYMSRLCKYPGDPTAIKQAEQHVLEAHAKKLTQELGTPVTVESILAGKHPRPRVLDMFAGGGSIPLEALRLGCEALALDVNPVAHIIELCTLVYPQKYGQPDATAKGCAKGGTWAGLAKEVEHWGKWVLDRTRAEIGELYPPIPDPDAEPQLMSGENHIPGMEPDDVLRIPGGYLTPVAYLWTRTIRCKNKKCNALLPLARQTWLSKRKGMSRAFKPVPDKASKTIRFELVSATTAAKLGFDPADHSQAGNVACPFCEAAADTDYIMRESKEGRLGTQLMAVVCTKEKAKSQKPTKGKTPPKKAKKKVLVKVFLAADSVDSSLLHNRAKELIEGYAASHNLTVPTEPINSKRPSPNARGLSAVTRYGMKTFGALFSERQSACLLGFCKVVRELAEQLDRTRYDSDRARAVTACVGLMASTLSDWNSTFTRWIAQGEFLGNTFARHALAMVWDFAELNPFGNASGNATDRLERLSAAIQSAANSSIRPADCHRGSALHLPWPDASIDAVITDPPYYDNIPYADISDYFYVWLKRAIGDVFPEHFSTELTPKKTEVTALASRFDGDMKQATENYLAMLQIAFGEAARVLKPYGQMVTVYAHKRSEGWETLVDSIRNAGFVVTEAWPLTTERGSRMIAMDAAALASSVFLVARKRNGAGKGKYEEVRPLLEEIVRERVDTLWQMGISGADLMISAIGAGLRAYTQHPSVEYANGDEVPASSYLSEVEAVVLEHLMEKIFSVAGPGVGSVDGTSRFYLLWRYTYKTAELESGEAIVFTYGLDIELDNGISTGNRALVEKKKGKYRLRDFTERGDEKKLGLPSDSGAPAPLIDVLHRMLWLVEREPRSLKKFLEEATPDRERLRLVAQTLAGRGLKGGADTAAPALVATTPAEQTALGKMLSNWNSLIDQPLAAEESRLTHKTPPP